MRGLALRVGAEARAGRLDAATVSAAAAMLDAPSDHAIAALELHAALAGAASAGVAGAPASAPAGHAAFVARMAETLRGHGEQQAAFQRTWAR